MKKTIVAAVIVGAVLAATPASANHDTIYSPCSTEYGYIHMTYDEWAAEITAMEADGTIPLGMVFRYNEELHGGKGNEDPRIVWAMNVADGTILSIDDWANGDYPEIEELNFAAGKVPEWILDANKVIRRFDDPYWGTPNALTPTFTIWQLLCMGDYGYSIPVMEVNDDGVWVSNIPATTTTTTVPPAPSDDGSSSTTSSTTSTTSTTTTTTLVVDNPTTVDDPLPPPDIDPIPGIDGIGSDNSGSNSYSSDPSYDLYDAEWDGWPFEATVRLLEERYVPNTPDRHHFPLSAAVDKRKYQTPMKA